jgi:hypothetical protein
VIGLVEPLGLPAPLCRASGYSVNHIMASRRTPVPAMWWKKPWNGPTSTLDRKPLVGEPPLIQDLVEGVE